MKSQLLQNHCYARSPASPGGGPVLRALQHLLAGDLEYQADDWSLLTDELRAEGVLPYFAYQLLHADTPLLEANRQMLKQELLQGEAEKLSDDSELALIFNTAAQNNIPMLIIKGEALARSLYPSAACRPTGDYDLLIQPGHLGAAQLMFEKLGYRGGVFNGQHMLAQQGWTCPAQVRGRTFLVDLHWDIANQRFFRRRASLSALWGDAQEISVIDGQIIVPSHPHALLIACTHLAADTPGTPIQLKWLLDIHLLLQAVSEAQVEELVVQARSWGLLDVLVFYCRLAESSLGPGRHAQVFERLAEHSTRFKGMCYRWTIDHRWFDFWEYGMRLPGFAARRACLKEILAYRQLRQARSP